MNRVKENPHNPQQVHVTVVGAGPAGLMAALAAAERGARVAVCEQLDEPGRKLLATGGGRCNLTNTLPDDELMARFGRHGRFMQPALAAMNSAGLRELFERLGVPTRSADGFHVFPVSENAATVLSALVRRCEAVKVVFLRRTCAQALRIEDGAVVGVEASGGEALVPAQAVIVATGGKSYPALGGTGSGYALAQQAGHSIVDPVPALVPLVTSEDLPGKCSGVVITGTRVWIDLPRHEKAGCTGDVLFTHFGLSGPAVLDLSGEVARLLNDAEKRGVGTAVVPIRVGLSPATTAREWLERFDEWQRQHGRRAVSNLLGEHLPASLAKAVCELAGTVPALTAAQLDRSARERLAEYLTGLPLTVTKTTGFGQAMVTRGGVSLKEVDPHTLASRLAKGLFFAGEILDLDGPCGGFNLQWAFSSGYLAGMNATTTASRHDEKSQRNR